MKLILFLCCLLSFSSLLAQEKTDSLNQQRIYELFLIGSNDSIQNYTDTLNKDNAFCSHWGGMQLGFIHFSNLPKEWKELDLNWNRSIVFQFNFCQYDLPISKNNQFGLLSGLGLEYQRFLFDNPSISITKENGELKIINLQEIEKQDICIKKSTFKNLYLTIPLMLEIQFLPQKEKTFYFMAGFMSGIRLHSKTKVVYKDAHGKHKQKRKGDFNVNPIKLDVAAQFGCHTFNIWGSYSLTHLFQAIDIHPFQIGIGINF